MKIAKDAIVSLEYTLRDDAGEVVDASDGDPLEYLHGHDVMVPGLERALAGKAKGDKLKVTVKPEDAYGERSEERVVLMRPDELPDDLTPEIGMEMQAEADDGTPISLWVAAVDDKGVTLDGNHPLAGETLHFEVEILGVRAATHEEIEHGHPHNPEGHPHD